MRGSGDGVPQKERVCSKTTTSTSGTCVDLAFDFREACRWESSFSSTGEKQGREKALLSDGHSPYWEEAGKQSHLLSDQSALRSKIPSSSPGPGLFPALLQRLRQKS